MNSNKLIENRWQDVLNILSPEDADSARAYLEDVREESYMKGVDSVRRFNKFFQVLAVLLLAATMTYVGVRTHHSFRCEQTVCPVCPECDYGEVPKWGRNASDPETWTFRGKQVTCNYSGRVMVCRYSDEPPETLPHLGEAE